MSALSYAQAVTVLARRMGIAGLGSAPTAAHLHLQAIRDPAYAKQLANVVSSRSSTAGRLLGLDVGSFFLGLAVTDSTNAYAIPLKTLELRKRRRLGLPKVANADKAFGKDMQEEAAQELIEG